MHFVCSVSKKPEMVIKLMTETRDWKGKTIFQFPLSLSFCVNKKLT